MRVLIADDSYLFVERLVIALEGVGGVEIVGQAGNAEQASEALRKLQPDAVILDLCMPGGSGIDVLKGMKRDQLTPVVIVLTSYGESQYRKKCLEIGASYFFEKATEFEKVSEVVRNLAAGARSDGRNGSPTAGREEGPGNLPVAQAGGAAASQQGVRRPARQPCLLVSRASKGEPVYYICSHCLRGFLLSAILPPKESMREMYDSFQKHVEQEHSDT